MPAQGVQERRQGRRGHPAEPASQGCGWVVQEARARATAPPRGKIQLPGITLLERRRTPRVARPMQAAPQRDSREYEGRSPPHELPPSEKPAAPNTGNAKQDKKYQQQQEKLMSNQNKELRKTSKAAGQGTSAIGKTAGERRKETASRAEASATDAAIRQARHTQQMQHLQQRQLKLPPALHPP